MTQASSHCNGWSLPPKAHVLSKLQHGRGGFLPTAGVVIGGRSAIGDRARRRCAGKQFGTQSPSWGMDAIIHPYMPIPSMDDGWMYQCIDVGVPTHTSIHPPSPLFSLSRVGRRRGWHATLGCAAVPRWRYCTYSTQNPTDRPSRPREKNEAAHVAGLCCVSSARCRRGGRLSFCISRFFSFFLSSFLFAFFFLTPTCLDFSP